MKDKYNHVKHYPIYESKIALDHHAYCLSLLRFTEQNLSDSFDWSCFALLSAEDPFAAVDL